MDRELVAAAMRGDEVAFSQLYRRYRDRVYNFAYRMLGNQGLAEDVTHEAFLVLIQHPERYQTEKGSLLTFLCAIARNNVSHYLRRRENRLMEPIDTLLETAEPKNEESLDPLIHLLREELASKIEEALTLLPPLQREVIMLREYQGLSYEEIAAVTGSDLSAVKVRLHRARQALAKHLATYMVTNGDPDHELR